MVVTCQPEYPVCQLFLRREQEVGGYLWWQHASLLTWPLLLCQGSQPTSEPLRLNWWFLHQKEQQPFHLKDPTSQLSTTKFLESLFSAYSTCVQSSRDCGATEPPEYLCFPVRQRKAQKPDVVSEVGLEHSASLNIGHCCWVKRTLMLMKSSKIAETIFICHLPRP